MIHFACTKQLTSEYGFRNSAFTIFMFILFGNLLGMIPYSFTFTSHIVVTFALHTSVSGVISAYVPSGLTSGSMHWLSPNPWPSVAEVPRDR